MAEGEGWIGGQADGGHFIIVVDLGEEDGTVCVCVCIVNVWTCVFQLRQ